ncbi:golgin subfamily A member 4 isoform X2 [Lutzomyia longipalpis]|uniref:golgin subfamily A member 4 isoform X2 n=1 Tax=Lutzomyia longipalpis TaxID=7200 RepID=UPI002483D514|nr:golgin subfamily A member 4 isoform X2 [Lutzomyia longipalpis]
MDQGVSLFQGNPSIQVADNSVDYDEEEEDRRRRGAEIQNELDRMFEDETADESEHFNNNFGAQGNPQQPWQMRAPTQGGTFIPVAGDMPRQGGEDGQMQRILEIRTQEAFELKKTLANEKKAHEMEMGKLEKCLAIANAEKERAIMTRTQANDLLVESKAKCSELNSTVARLQAKVQELQKQNSDMLVEIDSTNRMLKDSEMERRRVEGNALQRKEQLREMERKEAEVEKLQQQVNGLLKKVDDRELELRTWEKRYKELERSREAIIVEKTDTINDLMRTLGETQEQCNDLLSRPDLKHENFQLKQHIGALEKQADEMQKRIEGLTMQLHSTNQEMNLMETLADGSPINFVTADRKLPSSTPLSVETKHLTIRDELYRSLGALKEKREDIRKLQEEVRAKSLEIESLKEANNNSLIKIAEYEKEVMKLTQKLRLYEKESKGNHRISDGSDDLKEITCKFCGEFSDTAQTLLRESQVEIEKLKNEYCSLSSAKNDLLREINELKSQDFVKQLERLQNECDSLKRALEDKEDTIREKEKLIEKHKWDFEKEVAVHKEKHEKDKLENITKWRSQRNDSRDCSNCLNQLSDITKQEIANIQLQKDCANYLREINHLRAELKESADTVNDLHARLGLKEEQNRVIADLKEQAAKFGEFIKNCSTASTPQKVDSRDASVSTSPDMEGGYRDPGLIDQYAKAYAEEIKKLELEHRQKELRAEEAFRKLTAYRDEMQKEFEQKIHILRVAILSERKEYEQVIKDKETEMEHSTEEHNKIVNKYKQDLNRLRQQIEELQQMVRELKKQNETEKNAVMDLMTEWNLEKKNVKLREVEMRRLLEETTQKYEGAKQKALNYKKYSEQQDAHMKKEYDRIKQSYESYKIKLEQRLDELKKNYEKIMDEKITKMEDEYVRKLERFKET